jgi:uncharacterized membrane protein
MTPDVDDKTERDFAFLLKASNAVTYEKAQGEVMRWVVIIGLALFAAWLLHESTWQAKLDRALADCLTPLTDGTCAKRDPTAFR